MKMNNCSKCAGGRSITEDLGSGGIHGGDDIGAGVFVDVGKGESLGVAGEKEATLVYAKWGKGSVARSAEDEAETTVDAASLGLGGEEVLGKGKVDVPVGV